MLLVVALLAGACARPSGYEGYQNRAYTVRGVPETVVIGRDGLIAYVKYGASRGNAKALRDLRLAILRAEK